MTLNFFQSSLTSLRRGREGIGGARKKRFQGAVSFLGERRGLPKITLGFMGRLPRKSSERVLSGGVLRKKKAQDERKAPQEAKGFPHSFEDQRKESFVTKELMQKKRSCRRKWKERIGPVRIEMTLPQDNPKKGGPRV